MRTLADWATLIVESFVKYPPQLEITGTDTQVSIKGHRADHGKLIGKGCKNLDAIKCLLCEIADYPVSVTVLEPSVGQREAPDPFTPDLHWNKKKDDALKDLLRVIASGALKTCTVTSYTAQSQERGDETKFVVASKNMTPEIEASLYTIFRAIGNCRGRKVSVEGRTS